MGKKKSYGSLVLDITLSGLGGRVQKRTGYSNKKDLTQLREAIKGLHSRGEYGLLRLWIDDKVSNHEALKAYQTGLVSSDYLMRGRDLLTSLEEWGSSSQYVPENHRVHHHLLNRYKTDLEGQALGHCPEVLRSIKTRMTDEEPTSAFNALRKLCLSYVRNNSEDGTGSDIYQGIRKVAPFPVSSHRTADLHRPFDVHNLDHLCDLHNIPSHGQDWIWWMCLHGLRPKELWVDGWEIKTEGQLEYLEVYGQKTEGSRRRLPLFMTPPSPDVIPRTTVRTYLQRLGRSLYDTRRTAQVWWDNSRVPRNVIARWAGHDARKTMTELYLLQDDLNWIREHRAKVDIWLQTQMDISNVSKDADTFSPYSSRDEIGSKRSAASLQDIKNRLNAILEEWYNSDRKWMNNRYRVDHLVGPLED